MAFYNQRLIVVALARKRLIKWKTSKAIRPDSEMSTISLDECQQILQVFSAAHRVLCPETELVSELYTIFYVCWSCSTSPFMANRLWHPWSFLLELWIPVRHILSPCVHAISMPYPCHILGLQFGLAISLWSCSFQNIPIKFVHQFAGPFVWSQGFQSVSICARVCFLIILCRRPIDQRYFMLKVMTKLATWQKGELLVLQQVRTSKERHLQDNFGFSSNNRVSDDGSIIIRLYRYGGCVYHLAKGWNPGISFALPLSNWPHGGC